MPSRLASTTDFAFVDDLLGFGDDVPPRPGDRLKLEPGYLQTTDGDEIFDLDVTVVSVGDGTMILRSSDGEDLEVEATGWVEVVESPSIAALPDAHLQRDDPDGVAFADDAVDPALVARLREHVQRLADAEPVDFHPGSGTRVRDLVHPSLYPYVRGRSTATPPFPPAEEPEADRFGRPFESSAYQWLPTPVRIDADGQATFTSYVNNLDDARHPELRGDLGLLFSAALPWIASVLGYVEHTRFWVEDAPGIAHEGELPGMNGDVAAAEIPPVDLRGRELLVIPKIVEYRLAAGETHEGVWHVEGMSHEHIVATCLFVLDRDDALEGGELRFKRAYTVEEAGRVFWRISQGRPRPLDRLVGEGTVPVGSVATPRERVVVFPNSHIHQLGPLTVADGATEGRRRVIVFWIVDPAVRIPSTREVAAQQATIPRDEALAIRLDLMEERRRHKQTLNVRAVSLCEH